MRLERAVHGLDAARLAHGGNQHLVLPAPEGPLGDRPQQPFLDPKCQKIEPRLMPAASPIWLHGRVTEAMLGEQRRRRIEQPLARLKRLLLLPC